MNPPPFGTPLAAKLQTSSNRELRRRLLAGHPVDPSAIEGWAYRGTSIGLPGFIECLTWKTFQKTFWRDPLTGRLLGWNVRLEQDGPAHPAGAPSRPRMKGDRPLCCWHYEVIEPRGVAMPAGFDRGLIIDYGRGHAPTLDMRFIKDPLVAVEPGNNDLLLGVSYAVVLGACIVTPTWFTLEREHPVAFVPPELL